MAYLAYSLLILVTYQYSKPLECAYMNMSPNITKNAPPAIHPPILSAESIAVESVAKTITCVVKSNPSSNITWLHDPEISGVVSQNVTREGDYFITTGTFHIAVVVASMEGKNINCTGKSNFGSPVIQKTILKTKDHFTTLSVIPTKLTMNSKIQINCHVTGVLKVRSYQLYINNVLIGNPGDGKLSVDPSPSNCRDYTGTYKCMPYPSGEVKTVSREFDASVTLNASSITASEGQNVTFSCSAEGCQTSNVTWKKNGVSIGKRGNKLQLLSVKRIDSGEYSCHSTFWKDTDKSARVSFFLNYKPENVQFTTRTLKPKNGDRVTLSCSANGMPTPNFRIYKMTGSSRRLMSNGGTHTFYSINYADYPGFKATFRCESYNNVGTTTKDIEIEIQVKPIMVVSTDLNVTSGSNVTFSCNVTLANPSTNVVTWMSPANALIQHSNGVVMMNSVSTDQAGVYTCIAKNSAGETKQPFALNVDGVGGGGGGGGGGDGGFKWGKNLSSETRIIGRLIGGLLVLALICIQV